MRANPEKEFLGVGRLGEGIASGSKGSDKDLGLGDLPNKASDGKLKSLQPQTAKTGRK